MATLDVFVLLFAMVGLCCAAHGEEDLSSRYRFQQMLDNEGRYMMYWSFDLETGIIKFAVNVSTTGWVGFGLSPNGQMPLSDVVIGWVDDKGEAQFHDRFAKGRYEPEIDASQDWFLVAHREKDGRTVLEFSRALVTCDDEYDIAITADTSRIVWSYDANDPAGITGLAQHTNQGSRSINLLGGLNEDRLDIGSEEMYFDIRNDNVEIPSNSTTTYWCQLVRLPENIINSSSEHFMYKTSPVLTPHDRQFVHHLVVFLCPAISIHHFNGYCKDNPPNDIELCTNTRVLGSWAVGGEDFIYPNGVAFPIGTSKNEFYVVLEVHYDNPDLTPGVMDSSGMRFYYTATPPTHRAGIMTVGHLITGLMIVPPTTKGYTTSGICTPSCTSTHFPSDGITVFGNIFHTHLIGSSLKLRHYTRDTDCNGWKELEPIDQNLHYDFNYQQYNILSQTRKVMPGDAMDLECVYKSSRNKITLGGLSTTEEMCLSFIAYYPKLDLSICVSLPSLPSFQNFTDKYYPSANKSLEVIEHLANKKEDKIKEDFNSISWTPTALGDFESAVRTGNLTHYCVVNIMVKPLYNITGRSPHRSMSISASSNGVPNTLPPPTTLTLNPYGIADSISISASLLTTSALSILATRII